MLLFTYYYYLPTSGIGWPLYVAYHLDRCPHVWMVHNFSFFGSIRPNCESSSPGEPNATHLAKWLIPTKPIAHQPQPATIQRVVHSTTGHHPVHIICHVEWSWMGLLGAYGYVGHVDMLMFLGDM